MRKFATPIGSSQYPANGITLSLTQIPVSIQTPAIVTECPPCPDCECSFDDLVWFGSNISEYEFVDFQIGNSISIMNGMSGTFGAVIIGKNLTSADVEWEVTWEFTDEGTNPIVLYSNGFLVVVFIPQGMVTDDTITVSATVCNTTKTAILTMSGGA